MNFIVAVDKNWGIGKDNKLLAYIPEDMAYFKEKTINKIVIMGRNTFESLPNKEPLKDRHNIIITSDKNYTVKNAIVVNSIESAILYAKTLTLDENDIFFIGGARVYNECKKYCNTAYITKINNEYKADTFIENLDNDNNWKIVSTKEIESKKGITISFNIYKKNEKSVL